MKKTTKMDFNKICLCVISESDQWRNAAAGSAAGVEGEKSIALNIVKRHFLSVRRITSEIIYTYILYIVE